MKITLEQADLLETEITIRGNIASEEISNLLQILGKKGSDKVLLYKDDEQFIIDFNEIIYLETYGNRVNAYTETDVYESKLKLYELKELFENSSFAQINKSTLVNINYVKSIQAEFSGNYLIKLKNHKDTLTISRKYFKEFKNQI